MHIGYSLTLYLWQELRVRVRSSSFELDGDG